MSVWLPVLPQLLEKAPQAAGLDWDLLPPLVLRLEKTPRPAGLHSELPPVALASAFPLPPGR
jgi:hypothetical protein